MDKNAPEIAQLRMDIESHIQRKLRTPYDFESLSSAIWERLHENISSTTLKRLWGYIDGAASPRWTTLSLLSQFLGYTDWEQYLTQLALRDGIESETFRSKGILAERLQKGEEIEVTWLPNRRCRFRCEGNRRFRVIVSEHAKLQVGDTFSAAAFFIGQPLFLDKVIPANSLSDVPISYIAGKRNGILSVKKL